MDEGFFCSVRPESSSGAHLKVGAEPAMACKNAKLFALARSRPRTQLEVQDKKVAGTLGGSGRPAKREQTNGRECDVPRRKSDMRH